MHTEETIKHFVSTLQAVNIETINVCNYSNIHPECPVIERYERNGPQSLATNTIEKILRDLESLEFTGRVGFHHYSEPLMDKRLLDLVKMAVSINPECQVNIWTNGKKLFVENALEFAAAGAYWFRVSAYSDDEYERLSLVLSEVEKIYPEKQYEVVKQKLDDRMMIYDSAVVNDLRPCHDLGRLIIFTSTGEVQLCCMDHKNFFNFGKMNEKNLSDILQTSPYLDMRDVLTVAGGRKEYKLCSCCTW